MAFFDEQFSDLEYRMKVIKMFPPEFAKGYALYKQGKLGPEKDVGYCSVDEYKRLYGWYLLDPKAAIKFNINGSDYPIFINAIPAILDLDAA
jgi:hypothetical protein